jgi:pimeloyl-ACP methyl ester carboxylesterase
MDEHRAMANDLVTWEAAAPSDRCGPRWWRGATCCATFLIAPLGWFVPQRLFEHITEERLAQGLVLVLPGIEGRSFLNLSLLHGLLDAGLPYAVRVVDWTTGNKFLALYHLRAWRRNRRVAAQLAAQIVAYQRAYPGRPVWLIGHSGGGGVALLTAEALPEDSRLTGIVLLAPAVSPQFDVSRALGKVERGIWNFYSWLDWFFVGLGTTLFGTLDGRWGPAAGMVGFRTRAAAPPPGEMDESDGGTAVPRLRQTAYHWTMLRHFHAGGHFGVTHRVFIAEAVAPLLREASAREAATG